MKSYMDTIGAWLHAHPTAAKFAGMGLVAMGYYLAGDSANLSQTVTSILVMLGVPAVGASALAARSK